MRAGFFTFLNICSFSSFFFSSTSRRDGGSGGNFDCSKGGGTLHFFPTVEVDDVLVILDATDWFVEKVESAEPKDAAESPEPRRTVNWFDGWRAGSAGGGRFLPGNGGGAFFRGGRVGVSLSTGGGGRITRVFGPSGRLLLFLVTEEPWEASGGTLTVWLLDSKVGRLVAMDGGGGGGGRFPTWGREVVWPT